MGVNRQVYYRSLKRTKQKQEIATQVVAMIQEVRMKMPRIGTRKLYHLLYEQLRELNVGRDRLFAIMKANHLQIMPKKQYHITTNSHHRFRKHKNLVDGLVVKCPEQVWVSDITYIGTRENPMYLSLVTDAYSKLLMGYNVSTSLDASGALSALKMAIVNRKYPERELIHHSDRGLQYCCDAYQQLLDQATITCSMTETYDPYQNAVAERINGILKHEFILGITTSDVELMDKLIKQSIYIYNHDRPHWSCWMNTPAFMHQQNKVKIRNYRNKNSIELKPDAI
ncbi:IS3 family transposase [Reichenbachiella sp.]|uniref:IS3 family transposase n=1 Tax=Reichenbachiella sp. TaxID=2184521 RepID=UPI003BAE91CB